ncbi:site-2 protease family protein [Caulobacter sp. KR2-114]|uniref:site-2 protease family protein n=1 Tax=Caulobacter sp. KR2-114 TaxID=3400912 RepID=UPI003BFD9D14
MSIPQDTPGPAPGPWGAAAPQTGPDPSPNPNRSISGLAMGLITVWAATWAALGLMPQPPKVLTFAFVISGWILALSAHEFCHAWVADRGGDTTVEGRGYLTLNPLKYADPFMSIVIPVLVLAIGGIGFPGGAVYLRPDLMRSRLWRSAASLAGPGGTLAVLLGLSAAMALMQATGFSGAAGPAVALLAFLQATALVLNLLPIPGFDGFGALRPYIPPRVQLALLPVQRVAALLFIAALLWFPPLSVVLFGVAELLCALLGISPQLILDGLKSFQFWN